MIELIILAGILTLLTVGGILADYVLPRIEPLERLLADLPLLAEPEPAQEPGKPVEAPGTVQNLRLAA